MPSSVVRALDLFSGNFDHLQLKQCLHSPDTSIQVAAVKHILANMTIAKDMSSHFTDVAKLVSSPNFEIKKLVYLYLMHNAKSQPEKVVLYAGTFVRDTLHESPLIRGIALRTMSSLQVPAMVDFAHGVVLRCLSDKDPYVRRNATVAVLKLHRVAPTIIAEAGILHQLIELLTDPVAAVVAAAACALVELAQNEQASSSNNQQQKEQDDYGGGDESSTTQQGGGGGGGGGGGTILNTVTAHCDTLLAALSEATEWSQLYLLNALTFVFKPIEGRPPAKTPAEAETIIARVTHLLQSSNPAVVIGACRLLVNLLICFSPVMPGIRSPLNAVQQAAFERSISQKIASPLVSMLSGLRFEVRYVALRTIKALLHRCKDAFVQFVSQFFVKFDDPIFVKLEKIDIMLALATRANAELILSEFAEYSLEVDPEVVRRAVRSIGVLAVRVASVTPQCVERLVILIDSKVNFVVQEAAVVVQQILRQHPTAYERVIAKLCGALKVLDEPESKAAVVWVIGEYGGRRIANAPQILQVFLENFTEETRLVQRAVLTAAMKVYLTEPVGGTEKQKLLEEVFGLCTSSGIPDLRDRAFFYWRLLRADPAAAQKVVCAPREQIVDPGFLIQDRVLLNSVLSDIGNITSVCMKSSRALFGDGQGSKVHYDDADEPIAAADATTAGGAAAAAAGKGGGGASSAAASGTQQAEQGGGGSTTKHADAVASSSAALTSSSTSYETVLDASQHSGFSLQLAWTSGGAIPTPSLKARFSLQQQTDNSSSAAGPRSVKIDLFQINGNACGIGLARDFAPIELKSSGGGAGDAATTELVLNTNANNAKKPTMELQIAIRTDPLGVLYCKAPAIPMELLLAPSLPGGYDASAYARDFSQMNVAWSLPPPADNGSAPMSSERAVAPNALQIHRIHLIHRNDQPPLVGMHMFGSTANGTKLFAEVTLENNAVVLLNVKAEDVSMAEGFGQYVLKTLTVQQQQQRK